MSPFIGLAISVIPELLGLVAGDRSGKLGQTVSDVIKAVTKTDTPDSAAQAMVADPAMKASLQVQLATIALAAQQAQFADRQNEREAVAKADSMANANTSSARAGLARLAATSPMLARTPAVLSYIVVVGFMALLAMMLAGTFKLVTTNLDPAVLQIVNILIGALAAAFATVMNFWLGSSLGSRQKDSVLEYQATQPEASKAMPGPQSAAMVGGAVSAPPAPAVVPPDPRGSGQTAASPFNVPVGTPATLPASAPEQAEGRPPTPARPGLVSEAMPELSRPHRHFPDGVSWSLTADGIAIDGAAAKGTVGEPSTVRDVWQRFGQLCAASARKHGVPVELIVATIATESGGNPNARRPEPTINDESVGLMQTLVKTARGATGRSSLTGNDLLDPATSIDAGTAYIAQQRGSTHFDPPLVAAAYNAGSIKRDEADANRWKLHCFPRGTGRHIDKYVGFFSDCMRVARAGRWADGTDIPAFSREFPASGAIAAAPVIARTARAAATATVAGADFPPRPAFEPLKGLAARQKLFGTFAFVADPQPGNKEHIRVTDNWATTNIVNVRIPVKLAFRNTDSLTIPFHKDAQKQLLGLWLEWEKQGLTDRILSFDGGYVPRFIRGSTTELSNHAFGSAFDINAAFNGLKKQPALLGEKGCVRELVTIANDFGFFWGGHFRNRLDGMHFEIAELRP